jgi:hypothetical protein
MNFSDPDHATEAERNLPWEEEETAAAAREAAAIGGRAGDESIDPAQRPLVEGGEGVAEGFELAEADLVEAAEHGDSRANPRLDQFPVESEADLATVRYGEVDHQHSSELSSDDR